MKKIIALLLLFSMTPAVFAQSQGIDYLLESFDWYEVDEELDIYIGNREIGGFFGSDYGSIDNHVQYFVEDMDSQSTQIDKPITFLTWEYDNNNNEYRIISSIYFNPETLNDIDLETTNAYDISYFDLADAYILSDDIISEEELQSNTKLDNVSQDVVDLLENKFDSTLSEENFERVIAGEDMIEYNNVFEEKANNIFGDYLIKAEAKETDYGTNVIIVFKQGSVWSYDSMKSSALYSMSRYMESIQGETIETLQITAMADAVDDYGNESEVEMAYLMIYGSTLDKINFDNFDSDNIPIIADAFYFVE